ncbi:DUF3617 family protein [Dyella sp. C9]|uniref:DUF3617 domain-containing protein n=1 Tax=Dyella sp. C9 TaxID=2202154 RepID=UPI0013005165|nr:DUF3617 family protein [Dyella sp. C9]
MSARRRLLLAVALVGVTGATLAQDLPANLPKRKPGLWEMQTSAMGGRPQVMKLCLDANTDQDMYKMGAQMSGQMCSKFNISVQGTTVVSDAVCRIDGPNGTVNMSSHSETRFDGDTAYHTEGHMKYDPAMMGQSEMAMTSSGRWVGECPAGQHPGDMVMPDGSVMNIKEMQQQH